MGRSRRHSTDRRAYNDQSDHKVGQARQEQMERRGLLALLAYKDAIVSRHRICLVRNNSCLAYKYVRKERDDYPTPAWVTETVIPHLKALNVTSLWEPAAGEGGMAAALARADFAVTVTDLSGGIHSLDDRAPSKAASRCDAIVTNPPYGIQGKLAERFIERALDLTRPGQGAVAMLLKVDFDSGLTRRRFFADCPAWMTKLVLLKRIEWFKSLKR